MPDLSDALRNLFEEEARSFTTPSRGLNVLAAQARSARRRAVARSAGLSAVGVAAAGGLVFGSIHMLGAPDGLEPGTSALPSLAPIGGVTWDPEGAVADAIGDFTLPRCGEPFAPEAVSVGGVLPAPRGELQVSNEGEPLMLWVYDNFTSTGDVPTEFLALKGSVVFTQDGVVVATTEFSGGNLDLLKTSVTGGSGNAFWGHSSCAKQVAREAEFGDTLDSYTDLDPEQEEILMQRVQVFEDYWGMYLPSGDYTAYVVTPIIFGPQLAVAKEIKGTGLADLSRASSDLGSTPFAKDPRIALYCERIEGENPGDGSQNYCTPPQDVIDEVLTFEIDPESVVDLASGVAISEPLYLTVP